MSSDANASSTGVCVVNVPVPLNLGTAGGVSHIDYIVADRLRARPAGGHQHLPCVYSIKHHPILRRMCHYVAATRGIRGIVSVRPSVRK